MLDVINITETNLFKMIKFYNSLIKYDKFYNKFYKFYTKPNENEEEERWQTLGLLLKHAYKGTVGLFRLRPGR